MILQAYESKSLIPTDVCEETAVLESAYIAFRLAIDGIDSSPYLSESWSSEKEKVGTKFGAMAYNELLADSGKRWSEKIASSWR